MNENRRPLMIVGGLVGLIVLVALGWYLAAPLFVDDVVDEAFPFELPDSAAMEAMSDDEMKALEAEFMAAVPDEEALSQLSSEELAQVEKAVLDTAAEMPDNMAEEAMPAGADAWLVAANGSFVDADAFHQGEGSATIYQQGSERVLRFENFTVTNGPDLHVILSTHPAPATRADVGEDYIDLGSLKGNMGNQNYEIPADVDLSAYQSVVIYCVPFHVVFSTATLSL